MKASSKNGGQKAGSEASIRRHTRLSRPAQIVISCLIFGSFATGVSVWVGQTIQARDMETPSWLRTMLTLHGLLNPVMCVLFGWLLKQHIRVGWKHRVNIPTGIVMEASFAMLILTGMGLHYAPADWHDKIVWAHRISGVLMPLGLGLHWFTGLRWAASVEGQTPESSPGKPSQAADD